MFLTCRKWLVVLVPALMAGQTQRNPERAFAEMKVYDAKGSPLRMPRQDWDGARRRAAQDAAWKAWVGERRATVDDWIARRHDRVEWVAGWYHDFVSPKDGSHLTWTPEPPGENILSSPSDPHVALTPKLFAAWVFGFRGRHASMMVEASRLFRLTGEEKYAMWAAEQLDFYAANWGRWPLQTAHNPSRLMFQSLDDATVLRQHVETARTLGDWVTADQRTLWFTKLFKPTAELLNQSMERVHNIASWQRASTAQAALFGGDAELWKLAVDGEFGVRRQVRDGVTADYLWFEQSFGYNSYVVTALSPLFETAALAGRMDEFRHEMAVIENLMLSPIAMRFPTGQIPNPADATGGLRRAPEVDLLARMYQMFPTFVGLEAAGRKKSWETLLDPPEAVESRALPEVKSWNLESSRMAILRSGPWQVYFHYGQLDASHAQAEALNFEAFYRDLDVTHDPGTVGYGSPLHRDYYTKGLVHNVPLVDGAGQERWARGELIGFSATEVSARQPSYRPGVSVERKIAIVDEALVDTVTVKTSDGQRHRLGLTLHLQGEIAMPDGFTADPTRFASGYPAAFGYWDGARTGGSSRLRMRLGGRTFEVNFDAGRPLRVALGNLPEVPPLRRQAIYVELDGTEATFVTRVRAAD